MYVYFYMYIVLVLNHQGSSKRVNDGKIRIATSWENLFMPYANNKDADQTARISAFVVRCLDNIVLLVSIPEISSLYLASMAARASLSLTWSEIPKTDFLVTWLIMISLAMNGTNPKTPNLEKLNTIAVANKQATSRENVSSWIFDRVTFKPACSATEAS